MLYQLSYTPKSVAPSENQVGVYLLTFFPLRKREVKIFVTNQQAERKEGKQISKATRLAYLPHPAVTNL